MKSLIDRCLTLVFLACIIIWTGAGCKSQERIGKNSNSEVKDINLAMIQLLEGRDHNFRTMKSRKMDVVLEINGNSEKVKCNLAVYRDSMIAVSVIPILGYEVMRVLCTNDSVIIINRPDRTYMAGSFEKYRIKFGIPLTFRELQSVFINEFFHYKENYRRWSFREELRRSNGSHIYAIVAEKNGRNVCRQVAEINGTGTRLERNKVIDREARIRFVLEYKEFESVDEIDFPGSLLIDLQESRNSINLEMDYGQTVFNDSIRLDFAVPSNYKREELNYGI